jgi:hypothetical protein
MAKFIKLDTSGNLAEEPTGSVGGAPDSNKIPNLDVNGQLTVSMMPTGVGSESNVVLAGEVVANGDIVYFYDNAGTVECRKALADNDTTRAMGFVYDDSDQNNVVCYLEGTITGQVGLVPGTKYFLSSTVAGNLTTVISTTVGHIVQQVGTALNPTSVTFEPTQVVVRG